MIEMAFKPNQRHTEVYSHTKPCKNYLAERGLILSPGHHWEPSFVFALFSPQGYKWGWEMARQESNLMTNTRVILGCVIDVVQLYYRSCMTIFNAITLALPSSLPFKEGASARKVFSENIRDDFLIPMHFKPLPRQVKAAGNIKDFLWSFQRAGSVHLLKFPHIWRSRNMIFFFQLSRDYWSVGYVGQQAG